jgi:CubicO group peptidase (beta-lactamase class C family)
MWLRRGTAVRRGFKAKALIAMGAALALVAMPPVAGTTSALPQQTPDDTGAQLHPYVPDQAAPPERKAESEHKAEPEKKPEATVSAPPPPVASPAAGAAASSAAPKPKKPKPKPAAPLAAGTAAATSSAAAASTAPHPATAATTSPVTPVAHPPAAIPAPQTPAAKPASAPAPAPVPAAPPLAPPTSLNQKPLQPGPAIVQGPQRTFSTPISADDIETFTDSVVRSLMQRDHVVGATVAIVQGDTPLLVKGYGFDRLNPVRRVDPNNSLFRIGSISKVFTWIVARQEIEQGRIKLDAPIGNYLPDDVYKEDRSRKPLTLRDLMDHTGGYEDTSLGHLFTLDPTRLTSSDSYFRQHTPHRVRDPGQFSSYSNFGAALAARALMQTGKAKDVPSLIEARIFTPLGMDHSTLREPYDPSFVDTDGLPAPMANTLVQDLSDGFIWDGATYRAEPFDHTIAMSGALGASTTAKDMARFMSLMLDNGQLQGVQLFNIDSARAFREPMLNMPAGYNGWASGLMIRTMPTGQVAYGHGGATLWFNSNMVLVPDLNLGIFISTNTQTGAPLADDFATMLLDHLSGDVVRPPLMPAPEMAYADHRAYYDGIKGEYVSTRRAYGGLEGAITRLINTVEVNIDADGRLILTTDGGQSAYVPASAEGFFNQQDSEDPGPASALGGLHFLFKADGSKATAFETASNMARYERVSWIFQPGTLKIMSAIQIFTCVLVFLSLAKGAARHERPTETQGRATVISIGVALVWILAILVFQNWQSHIADDPNALFTRWPSGQVQFASWLAVIATIGTLYQAATFYLVYNGNGRYGDGWPEWQKITHGLLVLYWVIYVFVLMLWGGLQPLSW